MTKRPPWPECLTVEERFDIARARTDRLVDHFRYLIAMNEANALVLYGPTLSEQIPRSYAARAFNQFRNSMGMFEIVRLAASWDGPAQDRVSVPTVIALVNSRKVVRHAAKREGRRVAAYPVPAAINPDGIQGMEKWAAEQHQAAVEKRKTDVGEALAEAIELSRQYAASPEMTALQDARNRFIAHNLDLSDEVTEFRHGTEEVLLNAGLEVVAKLSYALSASDFAWDDARRQARRDAEQLWTNCRFSLPAPPAADGDQSTGLRK